MNCFIPLRNPPVLIELDIRAINNGKVQLIDAIPQDKPYKKKFLNGELVLILIIDDKF